MNTKRYTADELLGIKPARLQTIAREAGIAKPFHKNLTAKQRVERILRHYAKQDVASKAPVPVAAGDPVPVNAAFEAACDSGQVVSPSPIGEVDSPVENRGGARPGAGRPLGMTAERARMTHVTDIPHRIYKAGFRMLFDLWATAVGTDAVALTDEEACDLALPWSQMGEYLGWNDHIPEWADIILCGIWTTANTFKRKARIAREFRAAQKKKAPAAGAPKVEATNDPSWQETELT